MLQSLILSLTHLNFQIPKQVQFNQKMILLCRGRLQTVSQKVVFSFFSPLKQGFNRLAWSSQTHKDSPASGVAGIKGMCHLYMVRSVLAQHNRRC